MLVAVTVAAVRPACPAAALMEEPLVTRVHSPSALRRPQGVEFDEGAEEDPELRDVLPAWDPAEKGDALSFGSGDWEEEEEGEGGEEEGEGQGGAGAIPVEVIAGAGSACGGRGSEANLPCAWSGFDNQVFFNCSFIAAMLQAAEEGEASGPEAARGEELQV